MYYIYSVVLYIVYAAHASATRKHSRCRRLKDECYILLEDDSKDGAQCNHGDEEEGKDDAHGQDGAGDHEAELQEVLHVERQDGVDLVLIFAEPIHHTAGRSRVEEAHWTGQDLMGGVTT